MRYLLRTTTVLLVAPFLALTSSTSANAQSSSTCGPDAFARLIDETGNYLRDVSADAEPGLHRKFQALARARGWPGEEAEDRGYQLIQDQTTADYDARARKLLTELDRLGAVDADRATCANLERLETVTRELRLVTQAKLAHVKNRLNAALASKQDAHRRQPSAPIGSAKPADNSPTANIKRSRAPAKPPPSGSAWPSPNVTTNRQTATTADLRAKTTFASPLVEALPTRQVMPAEMTYSSQQISQAGHGLFGSLSAELASVIRYAFETYGAPNGYILGTEGGAAFVAGLSYGKGSLHTKIGPPTQVYWQGPSLGYDLGLAGSRVMVLVYNLDKPDDIFRRYGGLGGSAYVVGGVGLTFHKRGPIVLAPIRTGLGLRIGANIGYLKFTPERSLNPF